MSYILQILCAVLVLALPGLGWSTDWELPWAPLLFLVVPHGLAWWVRRNLLFARYRAASMTDRLLEWSAVLLHAAAVCLCGWTRIIESRWGLPADLTHWPGFGVLLGLLPFVVLQLVVIDARTRSLDPRRERRREIGGFQRRMFFSTLLPIVLFLGLSAVVSIDEAWQVRLEEVALYDTLFVAFLIVLFVAGFPYLLERVWETTPLDAGWMRVVLEDVARRAGFRCRELLVWRTGNNMANAAIVGFFPRGRIVLFTDALLAQLGPRELAAVFAHEIGHARGRHALVFVGFVLLLFLGADSLLTQLALGDQLAELAVFGGLVVVWLIGFGFLSRRFELEADLASLELLGDGEALLEALSRVGGSPGTRSGWRHFGRDRRREFLTAAAADPARGRRFRRRLGWWKGALAAVLVGLLIQRGVTLTGSWGGDQVMADLRLGEFSSAAARIAAGAKVDEAVADLAVRGAALGEGSWSPEELEEAARGALAAGRPDEARELGLLAQIRGHEGLDGVVDALAAVMGEGGEEGTPARALTPAELAALPPAWASLLHPPGAQELP